MVDTSAAFCDRPVGHIDRSTPGAPNDSAGVPDGYIRAGEYRRFRGNPAAGNETGSHVRLPGTGAVEILGDDAPLSARAWKVEGRRRVATASPGLRVRMCSPTARAPKPTSG